jgi:hypothetical protein
MTSVAVRPAQGVEDVPSHRRLRTREKKTRKEAYAVARKKAP